MKRLQVMLRGNLASWASECPGIEHEGGGDSMADGDGGRGVRPIEGGVGAARGGRGGCGGEGGSMGMGEDAGMWFQAVF